MIDIDIANCFCRFSWEAIREAVPEYDPWLLRWIYWAHQEGSLIWLPECITRTAAPSKVIPSVPFVADITTVVGSQYCPGGKKIALEQLAATSRHEARASLSDVTPSPTRPQLGCVA